MTSLEGLGSGLDGSLTLRALATYVDSYILDTGVTRVDTAGDLGNTVGNGVPHWRGNLSLAYQAGGIGIDARLRYIGSGKFDHLLATKTVNGITTGLVDNSLKARAYVDLGIRFAVDDRLTLSGNVNNLLNQRPPLITSVSAIYDVVGTYFNFGAKVKF